MRLDALLSPVLRRFMPLRRPVMTGIALVFLAPVALRAGLLPFQHRPMHYYEADWSSVGALPAAAAFRPARILILSGRTGGWKGVFAVHSWIVFKRSGDRQWSRYDVVGWGRPVRHNQWPPDGRWFGNRPVVVADLHGARADALVPKLEAAIASYPFAHRGDYRVWPGPNSNTFVATVLREVPELNAALPATAIGRDFRGLAYAGPTDSHSGYELNMLGLFGLKVAWVEGFELNLFGLVAGFDLRHPALKIPGYGRVGLDHTVRASGLSM